METPSLALFEETGAYLHGHFRLTSGLHSGEYLQCAKVLAHPEYAERLGRALGGKIRALTGDAAIDVVVAPAMGGIIIGHEVARALGARSLFTERDAATNSMTLRRGFEIAAGERAIVIEDVITTGGSTKEVVNAIAAAGARRFWRLGRLSTGAVVGRMWACRAWRSKRSRPWPISRRSVLCAGRDAACEAWFAAGLMYGKPGTGFGFRKRRGMLASPRFAHAEAAV